jgi:hypothetical protein
MIRPLIIVTQLTVLGVSLLSVAGFFGTHHTYLDWTAHFKPHYLIIALLGLLTALASSRSAPCIRAPPCAAIEWARATSSCGPRRLSCR